jgi:integrase
MASEKLKALDVQRAAPGLHPDGNGLYLQVTPGGSRSWLYRYSLHGKEHRIGLGSASAIPLKRARELAAEARRLRAEKIDPLQYRREQRSAKLVEQARAITFRQCAEAYIAAHEAGWRNPKHRQQWRNTLDSYVHPIIGDLPVQDIDTPLVLKCLEPIWQDKTDTASRIRGRIEIILDWAKFREFRSGENPARWRGHLQLALARPEKIAPHEHHAALPYAAIGELMADLRGRDSTSARCLEFLILTAARTGEVIGATWDEIDLSAKIWSVPAGRMKSNREHRVPLSDRAITILHAMQQRRENDFVFPGRSGGLSNMSLMAMLRTLGRSVTAHGMRSTFRDWAAEQTNFPREVAEQALAHVISNKVEAAYRRGDLFEKRRRLMAAWAEFCGKPSPSGAKVVKLNSQHISA